MPAGYSHGYSSETMPAAAPDDSLAAPAARSTSVTRKPRSASANALVRPMMPPPTTMKSPAAMSRVVEGADIGSQAYTAMNGFTVLEALVVAIVAMVLALVAWPSFAALLADHRRIVTVNALVASLQHARHAAVMQNRVVNVCPSVAGKECGDDWRAGWVAFLAPAGWRPGDGIPGGATLHRGDPAPGVAVDANRTLFRFRPHGRSTNGTIVVCPLRTIVVAPSGRVRRGEPRLDACPP
jgi:type IV fimbrial biogenesis protein FimT